RRRQSSLYCFFFSSRRRHTRSKRDWSSDVCSSDLRGRRSHLDRLLGLQRIDGDLVPRTGFLVVAGGQSGRTLVGVGGELGGHREIGRASCRERVERAGGGGRWKEKEGRTGWTTDRA